MKWSTRNVLAVVALSVTLKGSHRLRHYGSTCLEAAGVYVQSWSGVSAKRYENHR